MLITFEGIDGSGKSTQIDTLAGFLEQKNIKSQVFREPGGTDVSEQIRTLLLESDYELDPATELLLFSAARSRLVKEKVLPLLDEGYVVILDRFYDSTTAYQGYGRKDLDLDDIQRINQLASHRRAPDLTFYLKLTLQEAQKRTTHVEADRMEQSGDSFYERVIRGFNVLAQQNDRIITLDATLSKDLIARQVWSEVSKHLSSSADTD